MNMPASHMKRERPMLPERAKIVPGVAKMPVPMMRLKMRRVAEGIPSCRLASRATSNWAVEKSNGKERLVKN